MAEPQRLPTLPLWERWNREALQLQVRRIGPRAFARGFHLRPYTDEDKLFRSFESCYEPTIRLPEIIARRYPTFIGVDPAGKKRKGTALVALALERETKRRIPVDVRIGAWSSPETAGHLADMNRIHDVRFVMVENNALQEAIVDWIKTSEKAKGSDLWFKVEGFFTGREKTDEILGLPSLETEFANKAWAIPSNAFEAHEPGHDCSWCMWRDQMKNYPMWGASDAVMASYFAREAIARWGGLEGLATGIEDFNAR